MSTIFGHEVVLHLRCVSERSCGRRLSREAQPALSLGGSWLLENTRTALHEQLERTLPPAWSKSGPTCPNPLVLTDPALLDASSQSIVGAVSCRSHELTQN